MGMRLFLAFELPPEIKSSVTRTAHELHGISLAVKWVKVDNIHLTVVFIGDTAAEMLADIETSVGRICRKYDPFSISLGGLGIFGSRRNPRILWLGVDADRKRMGRLRRALQRALRPFGVKEEKRPFNPHLTLGRFRKGSRGDGRLEELLTDYSDLSGPVGSLRELTLFESKLGSQGAAYTRLKAWPLAGKR